MRQWLPLFMYMFPVTVFAALFLLCAALFEPNVSFFGTGQFSIFGVFFSPKYFGISMLGAGISGTMALLTPLLWRH